jgi:cysteinyl-tRNA synthetase
MSWKHLGETFDIHGGGIDLVFPHHENEIAQSRCAFHTGVMANYWMHNGFLQVEGEKMSKSLGNFVTIHELLNTEKFGKRRWSGQVLRLAMLRTHYRSPIDWTIKALDETDKTLRSWARVWVSGYGEATLHDDAQAILADDLNSPALITWLHQIYRKAESGHGEAARILTSSLQGLGFSNLFHAMSGEPGLTDEEKAVIHRFIEERNVARARKDFKESDRIRDELAAMGVVLKDSKDGTTWEIA